MASRASRLALSSLISAMGLFMLAMACTLTLPSFETQPQRAPNTLAPNTTPPAAPPIGPGPNLAPPFATPGALPWQPTPVPTAAPAATAHPARPTTRPAAAAPSITLASEIWDFPTGRYVRPGQTVYYAAGGDRYEHNLYERPFLEQTQAQFFPDLDIRYARLIRAGDWFLVVIRLHGLPYGGQAPTGDYGLELDINLDGRGDYLVWAKGPIPGQWDPTGVTVYRDARPDVEGPRACTSDAPLRGDGYDQIRYTADANTGLAWRAWAWDTEGSQRYPAVYIAFHRSLLDGHDQRLLWQVWADGGLRAAGQMAYHDRYTRNQAGVPYAKDKDFPIRAIARVDNTCRATFGFQPTGLEPCLCEQSTTQALCPVPNQPPAPGCTQTSPTLWTCNQSSGSNATRFYCVWDAELCQWSCRPEQICLPLSPNDAAKRLVPILPFGDPPPRGTNASGDSTAIPCYQTMFGCGPISINPSAPTLPDPPTPPLGPPVLPDPPTPPITQPGTDSPSLDPGDLRAIGTNGVTRACRWNETLCRWQCTEQAQCVQPDPGPNCQAQADGSYLCTTGQGNGQPITQQCRWNATTCRWECRTPGQCPAPLDPPAGQCQAQDATTWTCATDQGTQRCTWDAAACQWRCEFDRCAIPDQSCRLEAEIWVCPGKGQFGSCEWSQEKCRWVCWDTIRTQPDQGGEEQGECQSETYCSLDGELWYCQDGSVHSNCNYDGCRWTCE